jgi:peptide/nickel transport system permease protein
MNMHSEPMNLPLPKVHLQPRRSLWRRIYHGIFGGDALGFAGAVLLTLLLVVALVGPLLVTHDPLLTTPRTLLPPSAENWLGTDHFGRDVFSRTVTSLRIDFIVAGLGVTGAIFVGSFLGLVCGYAGGWFDELFMRLVDIVQSFPLLLIAMVLILVMGPGLVLAATIFSLNLVGDCLESRLDPRRAEG